MIEVHHLDDSRSQRILRLLEEIELPVEIVPYQRDPQTNLAAPTLHEAPPPSRRAGDVPSRVSL